MTKLNVYKVMLYSGTLFLREGDFAMQLINHEETLIRENNEGMFTSECQWYVTLLYKVYI